MYIKSRTRGSFHLFVWHSLVTHVSSFLGFYRVGAGLNLGGSVKELQVDFALDTHLMCSPLSAGVQLALHKNYNSGGRTVHITQDTPHAAPCAIQVSDTDGSGGHHRVRHN
jgi:hypothetical protein